MNELDITFSRRPWEGVLEEAEDSISALELLTLLEGEAEEDAEDAMDMLAQRHVAIDIKTLPKVPAAGALAARLRQEEQMVRQGNLMAGLDKNDPLRLYLEELAAIPAGTLDTADKEKLTDLLLPKTAELAQEYVGRGVLLLDLIQEANLGLWQGIQSYCGGDVRAHCGWWSRFYIARAITLQARANGVGQKLRQAMEDYRSVDEKLLTELGRNPTVEEIAEGLHMGVEETAVVADMLAGARHLQQVKTRSPEQLPQEEDQAVEDTAYFQMRQRIADLLSGVTEQDARLLTLRYGLEGGLPLNPQQTADRLGMTVQEVVDKETEILAKLRKEV